MRSQPGKWLLPGLLLRYGPAVVVLGALLAGCAGQDAHRRGMELFAQGDQEAGLAALADAVQRAPDEALYRLAYRNARQRMVQRLLADALRAQGDGRFPAAADLLNRALALAPGDGNVLAARESLTLARQRAEAESLSPPLLSDVEPAVSAAVLRTPVRLEFRETGIKLVLEALAQYGGLNFVLDKDVPDNLPVSVFLHDVPLSEALDVILTTRQLRSRMLNGNSLLIYPDTAAKLAEHQELVVRTIFLRNADAKQVVAMLKNVLKMRNLHSDDRLNLLVMRDTPATIRLAEQMVATNDVDEPEVMLQVAIVEVKRTSLLNLGLQFPNSLTLTPLPANGGTLTWEDLRNLNGSRLGATLPPLGVDLQDDTGTTNILANPSIRTRSREKAMIRIGDRVPVITTTATSTGFVSENVQYVDVGLKLEVEPVVAPGDEVTIKLSLEVSSVVKELVSAAGTVSYQLGGRNAATVLRLKNGETQMLGGLINDEDRRSANRFPGAGRLPVLGRLFRTESDDNAKTELVLSITPRVVRSLAPPPGIPREFWSGTEANPKLRSPLPAARSAALTPASPPVPTTVPPPVPTTEPPPVPTTVPPPGLSTESPLPPPANGPGNAVPNTAPVAPSSGPAGKEGAE